MRTAAIVTGGAGFMGRHMVERLTKHHNGPILVLDAQHIGDWFLECRESAGRSDVYFEKVDLTRPEDIERLLRRYGDILSKRLIVYHLAGIFNHTASRKLLMKVNVDGTKNLMRALKQSGLTGRVVVWSGAAVYGYFRLVTKTKPATEEHPLEPNNAYSESLVEKEKMALSLGISSGIEVTIMRLGAVYGEYGEYGMQKALDITRSGKAGPFVLGRGEKRSALVHAADVAKIAMFLAHKPEAAWQTCNVVDKTPYTQRELTIWLGERLGNPVFKRIYVPESLFRRFVLRELERVMERTGITPDVDPGLIKTVLIDNFTSNQKLRDLGFDREDAPEDERFTYPDSKQGLEHTIKWCEKNRWKKKSTLPWWIGVGLVTLAALSGWFFTLIVDPPLLILGGALVTHFIYGYLVQHTPGWARKLYPVLGAVNILALWVGGIMPYIGKIRNPYPFSLPKSLLGISGNDFMWNGLGVIPVSGQRLVPLELVPTTAYPLFNVLAGAIWLSMPIILFYGALPKGFTALAQFSKMPFRKLLKEYGRVARTALIVESIVVILTLLLVNFYL